MYRSNAETIYELSTFPRFYPLLTTAQTFEITALSSRRALKMFLYYFCIIPIQLLLYSQTEDLLCKKPYIYAMAMSKRARKPVVTREDSSADILRMSLMR